MDELGDWNEFSPEYQVRNAKALTPEQRQQVVDDVFGPGWGINNAHQYRIDLRSYELHVRQVEAKLNALRRAVLGGMGAGEAAALYRCIPSQIPFIGGKSIRTHFNALADAAAGL